MLYFRQFAHSIYYNIYSVYKNDNEAKYIRYRLQTIIITTFTGKNA